MFGGISAQCVLNKIAWYVWTNHTWLKLYSACRSTEWQIALFLLMHMYSWEGRGKSGSCFQKHGRRCARRDWLCTLLYVWGHFFLVVMKAADVVARRSSKSKKYAIPFLSPAQHNDFIVLNCSLNSHRGVSHQRNYTRPIWTAGKLRHCLSTLTVYYVYVYDS